MSYSYHDKFIEEELIESIYDDDYLKIYVKLGTDSYPINAVSYSNEIIFCRFGSLELDSGDEYGHESFSSRNFFCKLHERDL